MVVVGSGTVGVTGGGVTGGGVTGATGGTALMAFVHQSIKDGLPYDEMVRRMISANGKAGKTPEVGYILGDDADPARALVQEQRHMRKQSLREHVAGVRRVDLAVDRERGHTGRAPDADGG